MTIKKKEVKYSRE